MDSRNAFHSILSFLVGAIAVFALSACETPTTDVRKLDFSQSSPLPLPIDAKVAVVMAPTDRDNVLSFTLMDLYGTPARLREGWAISDGAKRVLKTAFRDVVTDSVPGDTDLVVSLKGHSVIDNFWLTYDVTSVVRLFLADGTPVGTYQGQAKIAGGTSGSERLLRDAYIKTMEQIVPQILNSSALVQRFTAPQNVAVDFTLLETRLGHPLKRADANVASATAIHTSAPTPPPAPSFPTASLKLHYPRGDSRPHDIAVIIGNADYGKTIPDVTPAHADADAFKQYVLEALGIRPGNIIDLRDATQADLVTVFGDESSHKGKLFNWVMPNISRVVVYYAGHGAPADDASAYIMPVDADPSTLHLNGYRLENLYANLSKLPATSVTVILESCFSGASQKGAVISNASPVFLRTKTALVPNGLTVVSAGAANQLASWEQDGSHSLFTKYYLTGMSGAADMHPYGNTDGTISMEELARYLDGTMTYYARRYYGRDQTAQIIRGDSR